MVEVRSHRPPRRLDESGVFSLLIEHDVWQADAACVVPEDAPAGAREAMWEAIDEPAESPERLAMLRALCASCPVVSECGAYAERARLRHGFYGGLTGEERKARRVGDDRAHELLVSAPRQQPRVGGGHGGDRRSVGYLVSAESDSAGGAATFDVEVERCVSRLHAIGVLPGVGRAEARDALQLDGYSVSVAVLAAAVRRRQPGGYDGGPRSAKSAAREARVTRCARRLDALGLAPDANLGASQAALREDGYDVPASVSAAAVHQRQSGGSDHQSRSEVAAGRARAGVAIAPAVVARRARPVVLVHDGSAARWHAAAERFATLGAMTAPAVCCSACLPRVCG